MTHGDHASTSDYARDLVRRDRRAHPELTTNDLRRIVDSASGIGAGSVADIMTEAREIASAQPSSRQVHPARLPPCV